MASLYTLNKKLVAAGIVAALSTLNLALPFSAPGEVCYNSMDGEKKDRKHPVLLLPIEMEKTESSQTVIEGIQLGFLGYMITVSAFVAEVYCLIESGHIWRVFGYMILSIGLSFGLGTLVYSTCLDQGLLFY
ncbi:uncharacterized protein LOC110008215 isoform X3 [Amborella trichopoda]|uniref:Uncharacterized protein n=1 Tax=Amborella trichopoda TaxID=13333 RepID=U5CV71_AMBTC|nr:uncharacterized protein LOC110008215 isoform X3 [Amborella trichopoda]XP_020529903.1 uncharacterized protein LOC110008215 isoform X3 [Amborella trichopoda]XP_020529904.1 uncharacterized protein LOC110008215 isoform X3 [Amborella trichopoda]ERN17226.1 hypothetical protein AMTR_s00044p00177800 [Amborella trichopoda]|eukprot:XP_020529902.1 uncharacterized protein LOC110008215 isoform X3 [Amborella trichopoda]